ncbi:MAG: outer membrane lipoprotein chaperone LolA [Pusillimonas sp.]
MIKKISMLVAGFVLGVVPLFAGASTAEAQLRHFIENVTSASGQFQQHTVAAQGRGKPAQTGDFSFQRPGKFRWTVQKPFEQLLVSDGQQVMQYDPDLAQVTQRRVDQSIGASPAAILFGSGSLDASFQLGALADRDGLAWLRATPRGADSGFKYVDMAFDNNLPVRLELLDAFGQTTVIELGKVSVNPTLPASEFRFVAPAGVDVVKLQ